MAQPSLFGASPQEAQQALQQQDQAQAHAFAGQMGPQGNPFYTPAIGSLFGQAGAATGRAMQGAFGVVPPEVQKAYTMQEVMQEVDSQGIEFDQDPVGYMKLAASSMLKRGLRDEAMAAINQAMSWDESQAQAQHLRTPKEGTGPKPSERERAMALLLPAVKYVRDGGELTPELHNDIMANLQIVEPPISSDSGALVAVPGSIRSEYQKLYQSPRQPQQASPQLPAGEVRGVDATSAEKAEIAKMRKAGMADKDIAIEMTKRARAKQGPSANKRPESAYGTETVTTGSGGEITPNPYTQAKNLNEATQTVLNDLRGKPIVAVYKALADAEELLKKYEGDKDIPGYGMVESLVTQGDAGMVKTLGRLGYQTAQDMGSERAKEANKLFQILDQFLAADITRWAGAAQTIPEATRQQLRTALGKGVVDQNVINALRAYKKVLNADMASYFGGVDPAVKEKLLKDKSYGDTFKMIFDAKDFGASGEDVPAGIPPGSRYTGKKVKGTGKRQYQAPDGSYWIED